jgi:hypothetical protein
MEEEEYNDIVTYIYKTKSTHSMQMKESKEKL